MSIKGNLVRNLPTLLRRTTRTYSGNAWGAGVLGVRFEFIEGQGVFSLDKVETHPKHPKHLWSHTRNVDVVAYPDKLIYSIPIYTEQDRLNCHTLLLSIATPEYIVPK